MTMSTQTLHEAARQLASVLIDTLRVCEIGEPVTSGIQVSRELIRHTPWVEQRRNLIVNPLFTAGITPWTNRNASAVVPLNNAAHVTTVGTTTQEGIGWTSGTGTITGARYSLGAMVTAPVGARMVLRLSNNINAVGETAFIGTGLPQRVDTSVVSAGANITLIVTTSLVAPAQVVVFDVDSVVYEMAAVAGDVFDGSSNPNGDLERTRWLGAVGTSASVIETRQFLGTVPGLVQTTTLANAVESRTDSTYSVKVAAGTALRAGQGIEVVSCVAEPDLVGKVLLLDKVSHNGLAMLRKAVASDFDMVNQQGKEGLA